MGRKAQPLYEVNLEINTSQFSRLHKSQPTDDKFYHKKRVLAIYSFSFSLSSMSIVVLPLYSLPHCHIAILYALSHCNVAILFIDNVNVKSHCHHMVNLTQQFPDLSVLASVSASLLSKGNITKLLG